MLSVSGAAHDHCLRLTGVFDGPLPGGLPKGVELYASCDVPDLSVYGLTSGGGTGRKDFTFDLPAGLSAGTFVYVSKETKKFAAFFGFAPTATASSAMDINGGRRD